jgi:hypothetical protein
MKINVFLLVIILSGLFYSCNQSSQNQNTNIDSIKTVKVEPQTTNLKLQIYYFHATNRCPTCNSIETNVKQVLETNYKAELEKGLINFKVMCVDDASNKALAEKYQAAGAALHLIKIENGVEKDNDLTEYAFSYSRNQPEVFLKGMKDTITYFIR